MIAIYVKDWNIMMKISAIVMVPKVFGSIVYNNYFWVDSDLYYSAFAVLNTPIYALMILVATVANIVPWYFMRRWHLLVTCPFYHN